MISLTPIAKKIQKRLFEKQNILGRSSSPNVSSDGNLNLINLTSRGVFVRMTSGLERPVIIMGGELIDNTNTPAGYSQVYNSDAGRPIPGIKNISVSYRGGTRALREATINWTCWSFDAIDRLTPHFLSVGKTVLLEWGWVYNKKSLINLPSFISSVTGKIKTSAYKDYRNVVVNAHGDFDMIVAIVKNFNFTTRQDGGFDCTTTISGMGSNTIQNIEPHISEVKENIQVNVSKNSTPAEIQAEEKRLAEAPKPETGTLKLIVKHLDLYISTKRFGHSSGNDWAKITEKFKNEPIEAKNTLGVLTGTYFLYEPNQWILEYENGGAFQKFLGKIVNVWVRWGWFEDNILSKFATTMADGKPGSVDIQPNSEFRSIERFLRVDGSESPNAEYESTRIKNHPSLETVDLNSYIIPGQYNPFKKPKNSSEVITGDDDYFHKLAKIVNENFNDFRPSTRIEESVSYTIKAGDNLGKIGKKFGLSADDIALNNNIKDSSKIKIGQKLKIDAKNKKAGGVTGRQDKSTGYFRNLLINTRVIKEAFGISDNDEFSNETVNIQEAIYNMFLLLNEPIHMWDLEIQVDESEPYRSKIVDKSIIIPLPDIKKKISSPFAKSKTSRSTYNGIDVTNNGVFYFPVWSNNSIVKSQNITATIPSSMAMSIMYGANSDEYSTAGSAPPEGGSEEGNAVGLLGKGVDNKDEKLSNVRSVMYKKNYENYGYKEGIKNGNVPMTPCYNKGGDDNLVEFFNSYELKRTIKDSTAKRKTNQRDQEGAMANSKLTSLENFIDDSIPPPLPDVLARQGIDAFEQLTILDNVIKTTNQFIQHPLAILYSSKFQADLKMKPLFIESILYNMQVVKSEKTTITDRSKPLLLPIEMELTIDGIGGIYPGNSYHSTYLPDRYKDQALFQAFDVNHTVDSSGWTTSISGKMRTTTERMTKVIIKPGEPILNIQEQFNKSLAKASKDTLKAETTTETAGGNGKDQQQGYQNFN